ncbi:MAG: O-antigen ligase family protein [Candidatus Sumerlaeia bacterium]
MTGPYQIPRPYLLALTFVAALGGCLDYTVGAIPVEIFPIAKFHYAYCHVFVGALLILDREGAWRRRLIGLVALVVAGLAIGYLMHDIADRVRRREVIALLFEAPAFYWWIAGLWLAAPLLTRERPDKTRRGPWLPWGMGLLLLYGTLCLAGALASSRPETSLYTYYQERAVYIAVLAGWVRAAERDEEFLRLSGLVVAWTLGALMAVSAAINLIDLFGGEAVRARFVQWGFVYAKADMAIHEIPKRRILFPMLHFNRAAYWAMIGMMAMLVAARTAAGRRRWLALALAAAGFWIVAQTYTRGIAVAAIAGAFIWVATISRRALLATAAVAILGAVVVPTTFTRQMKTVFDPQTYMVNQPPITSMKTRMMAWGWSLETIGDHPWTGLGYGRKITRRAYEQYVFTEGSAEARKSLSGTDEMGHMHNLWLETMVENGIPAGLALLGFCVVRWAALLLVWRRGALFDRGIAGAWLAMEAALFIAGMIFFMVKMNHGLLTLAVWVYCLAWVAGAMERIAADPLSEPINPSV